MGLGNASFDPRLWFLALAGSEIAGVALNLYAAETQTGWIDHLGVRREWRRQGLGMALLQHSFNEFYQRGVHLVKLNVDADSPTHAPRLYQRAGMHSVLQYHIYRRVLTVQTD